MDDCISRQGALDVLHGYFDGMLETDTVCPKDLYGLFEVMPAAPVREVVLCRECKYNANPPESGNAKCKLFYGMTNQYGFCHKAKRKTNG